MTCAPFAIDVLLRACGAPPGLRRVELTDQRFEVRLGWLFTLGVPRSSVVSAVADVARVGGIGAHGWGGTWLVNTSTRGIVRLELEPAGRGRVTGVPVGVRVLRLGLADPASFLEAVGTHDPGR
jgi:hypothetical protein